MIVSRELLKSGDVIPVGFSAKAQLVGEKIFVYHPKTKHVHWEGGFDHRVPKWNISKEGATPVVPPQGSWWCSTLGAGV